MYSVQTTVDPRRGPPEYLEQRKQQARADAFYRLAMEYIEPDARYQVETSTEDRQDPVPQWVFTVRARQL